MYNLWYIFIIISIVVMVAPQQKGAKELVIINKRFGLFVDGINRRYKEELGSDKTLVLLDEEIKNVKDKLPSCTPEKYKRYPEEKKKNLAEISQMAFNVQREYTQTSYRKDKNMAMRDIQTVTGQVINFRNHLQDIAKL